MEFSVHVAGGLDAGPGGRPGPARGWSVGGAFASGVVPDGPGSGGASELAVGGAGLRELGEARVAG